MNTRAFADQFATDLAQARGLPHEREHFLFIITEHLLHLRRAGVPMEPASLRDHLFEWLPPYNQAADPDDHP
jgi:hypothetical protein